jgi:hypothetical protein
MGFDRALFTKAALAEAAEKGLLCFVCEDVVEDATARCVDGHLVCKQHKLKGKKCGHLKVAKKGKSKDLERARKMRKIEHACKAEVRSPRVLNLQADVMIDKLEVQCLEFDSDDGDDDDDSDSDSDDGSGSRSGGDGGSDGDSFTRSAAASRANR